MNPVKLYSAPTKSMATSCQNVKVMRATLVSGLVMLWLWIGSTGLGQAAEQSIESESDTELRGYLVKPDGSAAGRVTVIDIPHGVLITADLSDIPEGTHSMHLHEKAFCDPATDFSSSGGHIAGNNKHGFYVNDGPHDGDMPNIHVPESGQLRVEVFQQRISIHGNADTSALLDNDGSALVIHSGPDDYLSQPAGAGGEPIACSELQMVAEPDEKDSN